MKRNRIVKDGEGKRSIQRLTMGGKDSITSRPPHSFQFVAGM